MTELQQVLSLVWHDGLKQTLEFAGAAFAFFVSRDFVCNLAGEFLSKVWSEDLYKVIHRRKDRQGRTHASVKTLRIITARPLAGKQYHQVTYISKDSLSSPRVTRIASKVSK
jgi:hypothetical protein